MFNEIDVHGMTASEAMKAVQRHIIELNKKNIKYFEIIHGYNNGDTLRKLFSNKANYHNKSVARISPG